MYTHNISTATVDSKCVPCSDTVCQSMTMRFVGYVGWCAAGLLSYTTVPWPVHFCKITPAYIGGEVHVYLTRPIRAQDILSCPSISLMSL